MRELSLHILDIIENAIRAGASVVSVTLREDVSGDLLEIVVEDNGPGLGVSGEQALDPFYTTKAGKGLGLGLSLFCAAAEQAGGRVELGRSALGGVSVKASMALGHVDRRPLGDLAATLSSVVCTNPDLDLCCRFVGTRGESVVRVSDLALEFRDSERGGLALARKVSERIKAGLGAMAGPI